jgi:hypothetical protein
VTTLAPRRHEASGELEAGRRGRSDVEKPLAASRILRRCRRGRTRSPRRRPRGGRRPAGIRQATSRPPAPDAGDCGSAELVVERKSASPSPARRRGDRTGSRSAPNVSQEDLGERVSRRRERKEPPCPGSAMFPRARGSRRHGEILDRASSPFTKTVAGPACTQPVVPSAAWQRREPGTNAPTARRPTATSELGPGERRHALTSPPGRSGSASFTGAGHRTRPSWVDHIDAHVGAEDVNDRATGQCRGVQGDVPPPVASG